MQHLRIGIISDTLVQQHHMRQVVEGIYLSVSSTQLTNRIIENFDQLNKIDNVDLWLAQVDLMKLPKCHQTHQFEQWLFEPQRSVIFGEGDCNNTAELSFQSWCRQLRDKVLNASIQIVSPNAKSPAKSVWVLAASAGGPEAVRQFLQHLPTGLGLALLYTQHIEDKHLLRLAESINRYSVYQCKQAIHGECLLNDSITLAPCNHSIKLMSDGRIIKNQKAWRGSYKPSIDQMVSNVVKIYGRDSGVIFFSGMGDDGATGARLMALHGGNVWTQSLSSCASHAMPKAIKETGLASLEGDPKQLASFLTRVLRTNQQRMVV